MEIGKPQEEVEVKPEPEEKPIKREETKPQHVPEPATAPSHR